jgi:hypothetical protein
MGGSTTPLFEHIQPVLIKLYGKVACMYLNQFQVIKVAFSELVPRVQTIPTLYALALWPYPRQVNGQGRALKKQLYPRWAATLIST